MWGVFLNLFRCLWGLCSPSSLEMERNEPTCSDPNFGASSSSTSLPVGDYEGGTKKMEENDYEVFLSFRGKDTRNGFTAHLYTSLANAPIRVFRDDNELRVGEKIGPELIRSITQSKISIPIISEDYASSKWCLRELALMLNCRRNKGQMVLPIFYKVELQQVKHLTGRFGDAIRTHKRNSEENIVKEWEEALKEVTTLKGWESKKIDNGNEATLVETVVKSIVRELKRLFLLDLPKHLVGIDDQLSNIMGFIDAKFSDTRIIGIYGMGGVGKTTLAMALYNKLFSHYEYHSFVLNIRETSMREGKGIEHVQKKLFCDITKKSWDAYDVNEGIRILESRLTSKKVLILLDDVDDNTHLKALIGDKSWFETGSIVIITTRNKSILKKASADYTHLLEGLPSNLSLILFSRHAFRKDSPPSDYEKISHALVSTTNGLPLAIEVIASQLGGESMEKWKYTLKKLKEVPAMEVQNRLRISYEALDDRDKHIFLDIACFFIGKSQQNPIYMWDACGFFPRSGIEELSHRSLIKIDGDGKFMMHDQLRDLGREIVRLEELTVPRNRSRLWSEEAKCVLDGNIGTSKIEALCLDLIYGTRSYTAEVFKELTNLRFLQLRGANLTGNFQNLLPQLRWLEWTGHHLDFELTNFHLEKLVVLNLSRSRTLEDWRGWNSLKMATELKVLDLSRCDLRTTPDLSTLKSLEILILEFCHGLEEIHPSIEDIKTLISLNVNYCQNLKELPLGVGGMKELRKLLITHTNIREIPISRGCLMKLETLNASYCRLLDELPKSLGSLMSLTQLDLSNTEIEELPESIGSLKKLQTLDASFCVSLACIPNSIGDLTSLSRLNLENCQKLAQLPNSIGSLVSLSWLSLSRCCSLRQITDLIGKLTSLTELHLRFMAIEELPKSIGFLKKLKILNASNCASLAHIPNSIGDLASLSHLDLENCYKLTQLPDSIGSLMSLSWLSLSKCRSLRQIPDLIGKLTSLTKLYLKSTAIEELPKSIGSLKKLKTLDASYSASLARIPNSIGDLASLSRLDLENCYKLAQLPNSISSLVSLPRLSLSECHSLRQIPDLIGKLTSLTKLYLKSTAIEELPESIGSLKKLETLDASYCALLAHIPNSIGDLVSLSHLDLGNCNKLTQLPNSIGSLMSLARLSLSKCSLLRQIPDLIGKLTSLTELYLNSTAIEELPESIGSLKKLKTLDVSYCKLLVRIPNSIGDLVSLSRLDLGNCNKLAQLPNSLSSLVSLPWLSLSGCYLLRQIPDLIGKLTSLTELHLKSMSIEELPESFGFLKKLETLYASYCASLAHIPNSIGDLASLSYLDLGNCHKLTKLPDSIGSLMSLSWLSLSECRSLRQIPDLIGKLTSLTELYLKSTAIEELPESIGSLKKLKTLDASYCASLAHIPNSIGNLASLSHLDLGNCNKLTQLPDSIGSLMSLSRLSLSECRSLRQIPDLIGKLISLTELYLNSTAIEELPESIESLKKLETLDASYCASLARIPNSIGNLASLCRLDLGNCNKLTQLPDSIGSLMSLSWLSLSECRSLKQIPDLIGKLTSLTELHLKSMSIEELPESVGFLKKLKTLDASYCELLARIPNSIGDLASLSSLDLGKCHKLTQLPDSIGSLSSLSRLSLSECHSLRQIPDLIGKLTSLTELHLKYTAIEELPKSIGNMQNLRMLDIGGTPIIELLDVRGIVAELQGLKALGWKDLEGPPNNDGQLVLQHNLDLDMHQKLSELRSRVLTLVILKCPKTPPTNNSAMGYQMADPKHSLKRSRPFGISNEVNNLKVKILPTTYDCQSLGQSSYSSDDLPKNVVITLSQGSIVKSMDFHPVQQILLLVGTNTGDVMVWEVGSGARIALRKFKVWDLGTCSMALQASLANDYTASVNRVMWSPDGILCGVAYSKNMVHIHSHHGGDDLRNHLEIEAHVGSVNDLAFSNPNKQLCIVTCGEDMSIKVWDATTGAKQQTFEGHEAPVYSICPHHKENIQFIISIATDGKIKTWFHDNMRSRADHDAPDHCSTMMAYSADGARLFSCGTNKEGASYLVEWNENEGAIKRTYHGLGKRSSGIVQFDTTKNRILAVGDEFMVKFWDMDDSNLLTSIDADGGLPASPCIRFNKEGILLAVSTSDNSIKVLANAYGIRLLRTVDNRPFDASRIIPGPLMKDSESMANVKPGIADDLKDKSRNWKPMEINEPLQCLSIKLHHNSTATKVPRLSYTNSGRAILALSSNAVHKLWKWEESDQNLTGRATTSVGPQPGGNLMTNDTCANPEDAVPCFALSKDDLRLISASGGEISCFYMETFQWFRKFTPPLPPNNDIIEIGMEDTAIQLYSGRVDEIEKKIKGHRRIIKGFAFSNSLNVLVSSSAESQMITFLPYSPSATFLAFDPRDDLTIAIGMDDSSIQICCFPFLEYKASLKGHQKRITSLAFSNVLNVLVSSGADSQLCVWSTDGWEMQASKFLQMPTGQGAAPFADTRVQFHVDQIYLLVVHETQIATCKAPELECLKQWDTREASAPITDATYSCDGQSIYVSFEDGSINVLSASTLRLRCHINPAAYIPPNPNLRVYPLVIAAHPSQPNQFALGLTDGSVYVLEPLKSEGEWGGSPPVENGAEPSTTSSATDSDQPQRSS